MKRKRQPKRIESLEAEDARRKAEAGIGPGDEVLPLYDFSRGVRGKYVQRLAATRQNLIVLLDADVSKAFPTQ